METTLVRQNGPAIAEDAACCRIVIAVKHMFHHVDISSSRDGVAQVGSQKPASCGKSSGFETRRCLIYGFRSIDQHAAQVRHSHENRRHQRAAAPAEVGHHVVIGKVPGTRYGHIVFGRRRAHDGAEDGPGIRVS